MLGPSSSLPGSRQRAGPTRGNGRTIKSPVVILCFLFDLAPGGVCLAKLVAQPAGELLPHRFTLTAPASVKKPARRFAFCCTFPGLTAGGRYPSPRPTEPGLSSRPAPQTADKAAHNAMAGDRPVHSEPPVT